jgi:hypothetical protein
LSPPSRRARAPGSETPLDTIGPPCRRHLEETGGHPESRNGIASRPFDGEIAPASLADLAGYGKRNRRANHLSAVGNQADVTVVARNGEDQEHEEYREAEDAVAAPGRAGGAAGTWSVGRSLARAELALSLASHQACRWLRMKGAPTSRENTTELGNEITECSIISPGAGLELLLR